MATLQERGGVAAQALAFGVLTAGAPKKCSNISATNLRAVGVSAIQMLSNHYETKRVSPRRAAGAQPER